MGRYYLTLDIGGTKTTSAIFTEDGKILDDYSYTAKSETFNGEEAVYHNTKKVLDTVLAHHKMSIKDVEGIGVGSPGPLDSKQGIIIHAPLMGWKNFPIVQRLSSDYNTRVLLENDGNLGALAEQRCGEAKGLSNIVYMTVSTGCGGGIIINKEIYQGSSGAAGEVGHISIMPDGLDCPCGSKGCFELYASGTAILRHMKEDLKAGIKSKVFELAGYKEEELDGKKLTDAADMGDEYALSLYKKEGYYLGVGIANIKNMLDPEVIVLGGGVTKARKYYHEELMSTLRSRTMQRVDDDFVRYSKLNDLVVLYGAFNLIKDYKK